jgi:hypothetical protein
MGHIDPHIVEKMPEHVTGMKVTKGDKEPEKCEACIKANMERKKFNNNENKATKPCIKYIQI